MNDSNPLRAKALETDSGSLSAPVFEMRPHDPVEAAVAPAATAKPNLFGTFTVIKGANVFPFMNERLSGFEE